jgi:hypothetical protein
MLALCSHSPARRPAHPWPNVKSALLRGSCRPTNVQQCLRSFNSDKKRYASLGTPSKQQGADTGSRGHETDVVVIGSGDSLHFVASLYATYVGIIVSMGHTVSHLKYPELRYALPVVATVQIGR